MDRNIISINKRIGLINQFIKAKECAKNNNIEEMTNICQSLLREDLSDVNFFFLIYWINI